MNRSYMENKQGKCLLCGAVLSEKSVVNFKNMPSSAQNIPDAVQVVKDCGIDLRLCQCKWCGLVQFDCAPVDYYKDVIRAGGFSTTMVDLRKNQYSYFIEKYGLEGKKFIEVGCGQGEFLSVLAEFPVKAFGIEHTPKLVDLAKEKGLDVLCDFIGNENKRIEGAPFDVFLSFNFLEHQPDPNGMLKGIYNNLTDDGMGLITVPSFEYILDKKCYYEFIRDHLAYYTFDTLTLLLNNNGFEVLEKMLVNRDTLSVIVRKRKNSNFCHIIENQRALYDEINLWVDKHSSLGRRVAVWGAGHQGFTIIPTTEIEDRIEYIIDSAPFKQGRFSPASHVEIISPQEAVGRAPDAILIIAPGYSEEIAKSIKNLFPENIEIATLRTEKMEIIRPFSKV